MGRKKTSVEVYRGKGGRLRARVRASNGRILMSSSQGNGYSRFVDLANALARCISIPRSEWVRLDK